MLFVLTLLRWARIAAFQVTGIGITGTVTVRLLQNEADFQGLYRELERRFINLTFKIPRLRQAADAQIAEAVASIDERVGKLPPGVTSFRRIPKVGMSDEQIVSELEQ